MAATSLKPCEDPDSKEYRQHRWDVWGDDPRYKRCRRCGAMDGDGISSEARYGRGQKLPERPRKHTHLFERCAFDRRYERCACGATRRCEGYDGYRDEGVWSHERA